MYMQSNTWSLKDVSLHSTTANFWYRTRLGDPRSGIETEIALFLYILVFDNF